MSQRKRAVPSVPYDGALPALRYCGAQIRARREARHLDVQDLAALVGLSDSAISALECGKQWVRVAKLLHIAAVLDLDMAALFDLPTPTIHATPQQWDFFRRFLTMDPLMQAAVIDVVQVHTRDRV